MDEFEPTFGLAPREDVGCTPVSHIFFGAEVGTVCLCGELTATEDQLALLCASPMGLLLVYGLALPICAN